MRADEKLDLRGGCSLRDAWETHSVPPRPLNENLQSRIIIIGNGITFSAMAARFIAEAIAGRTDALLDRFAIDRN